MKILFDTSVLVAFCVKNHPKHPSAKNWFSNSNTPKTHSYIASHSLVEAYSVLTRAPFNPKIDGNEAKQMLTRNILAHASLISLEGEDYKKVMIQLADNKLIGGISYDAIIVECAHKNGIQQIITANAKDFLRLKEAFKYEIEIIGI